MQLRVKKDCQYVYSYDITEIANEQTYGMFQSLIKESSDPNPALSSLTDKQTVSDFNQFYSALIV